MMNFDFSEQFREYSTVDLLKIINEPGGYQQAAVEAATLILATRTISETDLLEVAYYYDAFHKVAALRKEKIQGFKERAVDFLEPVIKPGVEVKPAKWVNVLLLVIGLQYLWSLFNTLKQLLSFLKCRSCNFDFYNLIDIFSLLYVPFIFFLLLKKIRWGWILLFADSLFSAIAQLSQFPIFLQYRDVAGASIPAFFIPIIIKGFFVFFLWRSEISDLFSVTLDVKKKTASVTVVITLLFIITMTLLYG